MAKKKHPVKKNVIVDSTTIKDTLDAYAQKGSYKAAEKYLKQNEEVLKKVFEAEGKEGIIKNFYQPYATAYDKNDFDFCSKYEKAIDEILEISGQDSALFIENEY